MDIYHKLFLVARKEQLHRARLIPNWGPPRILDLGTATETCLTYGPLHISALIGRWASVCKTEHGPSDVTDGIYRYRDWHLGN